MYHLTGRPLLDKRTLLTGSEKQPQGLYFLSQRDIASRSAQGLKRWEHEQDPRVFADLGGWVNNLCLAPASPKK